MSIYYSNRTSTLKLIYDRIETACTTHPAIAEYDCGDLQNFSIDYKYPLAYLETINFFEENERKNGEIYSVAINLLDRQPPESQLADTINVHDGLCQLMTEIKSYLEQKSVFGDSHIGSAKITVFNDFDDAKLVRLRCEFTIDVDKLVTSMVDIKTIYKL